MYVQDNKNAIMIIVLKRIVYNLIFAILYF